MWDPAEIHAAGITAILSVNNGDAVHRTMLENLGIEHAVIPMSANAPARDGDRDICLANLPQAMHFIRRNLSNGPVLIHCRSGKDRTAMVMAAYLIEFEGYDVGRAMQTVIDARPVAFTAEGWRAFTRDVLGHFMAGDRGTA